MCWWLELLRTKGWQGCGKTSRLWMTWTDTGQLRPSAQTSLSVRKLSSANT